MLGELILPVLDENDAWAMALELVRYDSRAFLVTMLKALTERYQNAGLNLRSSGARTFFAYVSENEIDAKKTLERMLPVLRTSDDVAWLLRKLHVEEGLPRLSHLVNVATLPCSYALFVTLHHADPERPLLIRIVRFLMRRGDALGFNLASLLRTCYDLVEINGTFSLHLQPYQLARIENSYEAFCQAMKL